MWPTKAASTQVASPQGQGGSWERTHRSSERCPPLAALAQVHALQPHGGSWARAHCRTSKRPSSAAKSQTHSRQEESFRPQNHAARLTDVTISRRGVWEASPGKALSEARSQRRQTRRRAREGPPRASESNSRGKRSN